MSDDDTIIKGRVRRRTAALLLGIAIILAGSSLAWGAASFRRWDLTAVGLCVLFIGLGVMMVLTWPYLKLGLTPVADPVQRQRAMVLALSAGFAPFFLHTLWRESGRIIEGGGDVGFGYAMVGGIFACGLILLAALFGVGALKTALDDEYSRALRARAVLIGFSVLLCGGLAVFGFGSGYPTLALRALPLVLFTGIVATVASYALMDLLADPDE